MRGNDLSNEPTRRYWVVVDAVLVADTSVEEKKTRWWKRGQTTGYSRRMMPDLAVLSKLWRWSASQGVRLELLFVENTGDASAVWDMLEKGAANPFSDWLPYESFGKIAHDIAYRPDLLGIIDIPERCAIYGGKGLTVNEVP